MSFPSDLGRAESLPNLHNDAARFSVTDKVVAKAGKKSQASGASLKQWLPVLDRRSIVFGACSETIRRGELMESLQRYRSQGDLVKLRTAVHNAKLDYELRDRATVDSMLDIVVRATKQKHICEMVARRAVNWNFSTKDARCLETAVKQLQAMGLGPKVWNDPQYPLLPKAQEIIPHLSHLQHLSKQYREDSVQFTSAWLNTVTSTCLCLPLDLEVSVARWFLDVADSMTLLTNELGDNATELLDFVESSKVKDYPISSEDVQRLSDAASEKLGRELGVIGLALALAGGFRVDVC